MADFPIALSNVTDNTSDVLAKHINNLEAKVGINGSADTNSLDYKVANKLGLHAKADTAGVADSATGNAGTATKLATARKINGTSFDGSADITTSIKPHQIYCLGDSLTYGTGSGDMGITERLQALLGNIWNVNNNGVAGNTTTQMLARLNSDILNFGDAEYVLVWGGINDIYTSVSNATIESNLQAIYTAIHNAGAKVISLNVTPSKNNAGYNGTIQTNTDAINTWIAGTATNIDYKIDVYTLVEDPGAADTLLAAYDSSDHLHLQQDGYYAVAKAVYTGVVSSNNSWLPTVTTSISDNIAKGDGWLPVIEAWAYYGAKTFYSAEDTRTKYQKGDKVKLIQAGVPKYFYITGGPTGAKGSGSFNFNCEGGNDYAVANSYSTSKYISKADNPQGFPQWFAWTPVLTGSGGSAGTYAISVQYAGFRITGKTAEVVATFTISNVGSWSGNVLLQMPLIPSTKADDSVQLLQQGTVGTNGSLVIQGYTYAINSSGVMNFVSAFNSTILAWGAGLASSVVSIKARYEI